MARPARLALTGTTAALLLGLTGCAGGSGAASSSSAAPTSGSASSGSASSSSSSSAAASSAQGSSDGTVTLYSGRNQELVQPILDRFSKDTGITVEVRYGNTAAMAAQLLEEGEKSPAEAFLAQDAGALGAAAKEDVLEKLPQQTLDAVPQQYRDAEGRWVGLTGRSRVLVYNPEKVSEADLPKTVAELTDPKWAGRVGLAPTNASFQSFITAMRVSQGDDAARAWLTGMAENDPQIRDKNGVIVKDVAAGTLDAGLVNHYYIGEVAKEEGVAPEQLKAKLHFFQDGDLGGLVNVSGIGLVGDQKDADAQKLVDYLLSDAAQEYFVKETFEYPMTSGVQGPAGVPALKDLKAPELDLNKLDDLKATVSMIEDSGLL